jgi:hypothetical protein
MGQKSAETQNFFDSIVQNLNHQLDAKQISILHQKIEMIKSQSSFAEPQQHYQSQGLHVNPADMLFSSLPNQQKQEPLIRSKQNVQARTFSFQQKAITPLKRPHQELQNGSSHRPGQPDTCVKQKPERSRYSGTPYSRSFDIYETSETSEKSEDRTTNLE